MCIRDRYQRRVRGFFSCFVDSSFLPLSIMAQSTPLESHFDDLFSVNGKVVLVTGGGRGIGYMIAKGFVLGGSRVYICSRDFQTCVKVAKQLNELASKRPNCQGKCIAIEEAIDFSVDPVKTARQVKEYLLQKEGKLDVLINNSGIAWGEPLEKYSEKGWDRVFTVNAKACFYLIQQLYPLLETAAKQNLDKPAENDRSPSAIINIGSIAGLFPQEIPTYAYDMSKAALHHLTTKLASEFGSNNITVNAVAPGLVPSRMSKGIFTYVPSDVVKSNIPLQRFGTESDMAAICLFLASRAGSWVSGAIIPIDGGSYVSRHAKL
eukprot:TRINITY_DN1507_c0_g4_i2.p1 TRINITY_DN1507_c0_g4~~TRINITY_DN1507_c0_g4_i2.p1  ORF type:complete len:321 (+),score=91.11 TRINITY_DN1507_c0_g4_i2:1-963(+)